MNDQLFISQIRRSLDESTGHLPYRVTQRLAAARQQAVAAAAPAVANRVAPAAVSRAFMQSGGQLMMGGTPSPAWRIALSILPMVAVAACLYGISVWTDAQNVDEVTEIDAAVLTGDVPIAAYADRGFGVFIQNNNRQQ